MYRTTTQGRSLAANPALAKMLGYDSAEEVITAITDTAHQLWMDPDERSRCVKLLEAHGAVHGFECRFRRKDGTAIWVSINLRKVCPDERTAYFEGFIVDIAERKRIEDALRKSEEKFEKAFLSSPAVTILFKPDVEGNRIVEVNQAFEYATGYSREEVIGHTSRELGLWADPRDLAEFLRQVRATGRIRNFEFAFRTKTGEIRLAVVSVESIEIDAKPCAIATVIDVTEQKRAQRAIQQANEAVLKAERQYRLMFNSVSDAIFVHKFAEDGAPGHFIEVNDNACRYLGYTREELLQMEPSQIDSPEEHAEIPVRAKKILADGHLIWEGSHVAKDGRRIPVEVNTHLADLDGSPMIVSSVRDISERKKIEETIRTLAVAIEQTSETVVITNCDGTIQYCNPAFEKVTGYTKEEAIGLNPRVLKSGKHDYRFYGQMWATITEGRIWAGHLTNKRKDGSLFEEDATISPIRDAAGRISGFVAVKRDVTERLQLEDQLRQAQKLESIGRLAGGVAHDFNNLLTVINGYGDLLLKRLVAPDPLRAYAIHIREAGERAASMTKQLLAFSRKQVIEPRVLDLNATIAESVPMLQPLIGEDVVLKTLLGDGLGQVLADADQIHQVLMNLAVNARDAMPDGGRLDIVTANIELDAENSTAIDPERLPGRYVLMTVTDTGKGMDEATRQRIFEPFFTTKEIGRGTGLGLSTVYGIIRQNGGWVDVASEIGVGTSFQVYFPRIDACPAPKDVGNSPVTDGGQETILVVEDQTTVRHFAVTALRQYGYRVVDASGGEEAISLAGRYAGEIHLLLTDVVMPGMSGKELSERLEELRPNLKVLFTSGYTADVISNRGVLDRGVTFLHKPFSPEELAAKVREVLAGP
jgi:PAS domain S-box-containing protein